MTRIHHRCAAVLSATVFVCTLAAAADPKSLAQCRALGVAAARLACYDAIPLPPPVAAVPAAPATSARPAAPSGAATAAAANVPPAATAGELGFGLEHRAPAGRADEMVSRIVGPFRGWERRTRFRLANGQLWEIADGSRAAYWSSDPAVRITRGSLGSFHMQIEGVSTTPKVRRVE